ncbi:MULTISPECIES: hypothetical protein [unclassified Cryobacterium]|uniref:hypothetical protein n=1 Tax=unclassified Cryobacterium TaxID=2649013 RepID=UPI002AB378CE|nr:MULTISPECIES: hypothetical protein [unclassified Cryobacterium]MDY7543131.1 hypothetical protein [Cryobacterium sp. 5B3]MEA9998816.1 hypothetical protein [Cryobacterium sp. RTS3]MEB0265497.1 hypothetical protein [Cryobacterium sp. 10I5]
MKAVIDSFVEVMSAPSTSGPTPANPMIHELGSLGFSGATVAVTAGASVGSIVLAVEAAEAVGAGDGASAFWLAHPDSRMANASSPASRAVVYLDASSNMPIPPSPC